MPSASRMMEGSNVFFIVVTCILISEFPGVMVIRVFSR